MIPASELFEFPQQNDLKEFNGMQTDSYPNFN